MAEARLKAIITAEDRASGVLGRATRSTGRLQKATDGVRGAVLGLTGAYIGIHGLKGAIGGTIGAAISYESAFAGVRKTVDASEEELQRLSERFREMSLVMPVTAEEFARIGELAGQLGVQASDIDKFSEVVAKIGSTTNLTTEEAATSFARLSNIMDLPLQQVDRLGSAIVGLGNNFAATESEITSMGLRLAGASKVVGISESEMLGLSTALVSVGIRAEAGGSAVSRTMIKISEAVSQGGETLDTFARTAGIEAQEFARQWREDPVNALIGFVNGLSRAQEGGKDLFGVLKELGIEEVRERDALLRLAGAQDLVNEAVAKGREEFEKNNALQEEFAKRAETTEAQLQILKNTFHELGVEIGDFALPTLNKWIKQLVEGIRVAREGRADLIPQDIAKIRKMEERGGLTVEEIRERIQRGELTRESLKAGLSFQEGGVVPGPRGKAVPAIVHGGETVLPEGVNPINININNPVVREDQDIDRIVRRVTEALSRRNEFARLGAL